MPVSDIRNLRRIGLLAAAAALALTGCAPVIETGSPSAPLAWQVTADDELAALVPEPVRADGLLDIGTDPSYPPMQYINSDRLLTGLDVQLAAAVAAKLDLRPSFTTEAFSALESGVRAGRFEVGVAALSMAPGQRFGADAVLYLVSGTRLARPVRSDLSLDLLCGHVISALEGSGQLADLARQSQDCQNEGSPGITIVAGESQQEATKALLIGRAEGMVADAPAVQYAVRAYANELQMAPGVATPVPFVMLTEGPDEALGEAVAAALNELIAEGTYDAILSSYGFTEGAVDQAVVIPAGGTYATPPVASRSVNQTP